MADTSQDRDRIHRIVRSALDAHPLAGKDYPAGAYYCACGHISRIDDPAGRARPLPHPVLTGGLTRCIYWRGGVSDRHS